LGECGLRGGYFELFGIPENVRQEIYKLASISLCSNTVGQIATGLMVNPPQSGDESFTLFTQEKDAILQSMKRRAVLLSKSLNQIDGISCTEIEGAMYAFPTIELPGRLFHSCVLILDLFPLFSKSRGRGGSSRSCSR
jgi:alanine transaminase